MLEKRGFRVALLLLIFGGSYLGADLLSDNEGSRRFLIIRNEGRVISLWQNNTQPKNLVQDLEIATAFDFSYRENLLFFQDNKDRIKAIKIDNIKEHYIVAHNYDEDLEAMAVDWVTKKIYWVARRSTWAQSKCRIDMATFDGSIWTALLHLDSTMSVGSLAVDPLRGYMFWVDTDDWEIVRAWMDGTHETTIVKSPRRFINNFVIDYADSGRIYWSEVDRISGSNNQIVSANFFGKDRKVVRKIPTLGYVMAVYQNHLYWILVNTNRLFKCVKHPVVCENTETNIVEKFEYGNFHVYERDAQPERALPNSCAINNGNCSDLCVLTPFPPYRSCRCSIGIRLLEDNVTCQSGYEHLLFVVTRTDLRYISLDTSDFTDVTIPLKHVEHAVAIDYDPTTGIFYWTDQKLKKIRRAMLNGSGEADVVKTELDIPDGIAVDWVAKNIYWTDPGTARIEVSRMDGSARRVLISTGLSKPRAIVLDPEKGFMYWSDWHSDSGLEPKIEKAYMDGSNRVELIHLGPGHWPNGLALDTKRRLIYWIDAKTDELGVASSVDGSQRRILVKGDMQRPFSLSLLGDWLYWSDADRRTVVRVKTDGTQRDHVSLDIADLYCIKAVNMKRDPGVINECSINNGNCSHLCLYRPTGRVCRCPIGLELSQNRTYCVVPEKFLIFTQRTKHDIMRISLSTPSTRNMDRLGLQDRGQPMLLDYHAKTDRVYWASSYPELCTDNSGCSAIISHAFLNGTGQKEIIHTGLMAVEGLAVDWIAMNLYWSDWTSKTIEVSRLDGSSRRVVVWRNVKPRHLVVDPTDGYLYWSNWEDSHPTIQRAELDGSNRATLVELKERGLYLALDHVHGKLYWSELGQLPGIWSCDLNGGSKKEILVGNHGTSFGAVTHFGGMLYFTDWARSAIEEINATTGQDRKVLHENLPWVFNLKVVHTLYQKGWNHCYAPYNGGCDNLCFAVPALHGGEQTTFRCSCPTHYELINKKCQAPGLFLFVAQNGKLARFKLDFSLRTPKFNEYPIVVLPFEDGLGQPRSLQYDPVRREVYWIDSLVVSQEHTQRNGRAVIRRAKDDASSQVETLSTKDLGLKDKCDPATIAIDSYTQQMFVVCRELNAVYALRMRSDGSFDPLGMVLDGGTEYKIGSFAVSPTAKYMVFVEEHEQRLIRCNIDGRGCRSLLDSLDFCEAIMVNREWRGEGYGRTGYKDYIYFTNSYSVRKISLAGIERNNRKGTPFAHASLNRDAAGVIPTLVSVGSKLVLMNPRSSELSTIRTEYHGNVQVPEHEIEARLTKVSGILFVNRSVVDDLGNSQCLRARCSHLCSGEGDCQCPRGMTLNRDMKTCQESKACQKYEFHCSTQNQCVHFRNRCDGNPHCLDESDEGDCGLCWGQGTFRCDDGNCLNIEKYCDGISDCVDGSDESHCRCDRPQDFFDCSWVKTDSSSKQRDLTCVNRAALCDGHKNCSGRADEHPMTCPNRKPIAATDLTDDDSKRNGGTSQDSTIVIGIIALISVCFLLLALFFLIWWCKRQSVPTKPPEVYEMAPLERDGSFHPSTATGTHTLMTSAGGGTVLRMNVDLHHKINIQTDSSGFSGSVPLMAYERNANLTGKSSSSGDRSSYPEQPVPPPSLVSTRRSGRVKRTKRRRSNRRPVVPSQRSPPPPYSDDCRYTPCSTEVLDGDSEIPAPPSSVVSNVQDMPGTSTEYGEINAPPPSLVTVTFRKPSNRFFKKSSKSSSQDSTQNGDYDELRGPLVGTEAPNPSPNQSQAGTDSDLYAEYLPPPPSPANGSSDS